MEYYNVVYVCDEIWNTTYDLLLEFINLFDRFPNVNEFYKYINLHLWIEEQINSYRNGTLFSDKFKKLIIIPNFFKIKNITKIDTRSQMLAMILNYNTKILHEVIYFDI